MLRGVLIGSFLLLNVYPASISFQEYKKIKANLDSDPGRHSDSRQILYIESEI